MNPQYLWHPLANGHPPPWADAWGQDRYGVWVGFSIGEACQRLRWIRPGKFLMGSPADESGRFSNEGPQHPVTISEGYWLFDTPCTQALWQAAMGDNPSRFKQELGRPVEQVSWLDAQTFIGRINKIIPGLSLSLPTEAQWEYACRAGITGATYEDDLDEMAWYGSNSNSETHNVGLKRPNGWGLYDVLGNVLEWCEDGRREYIERVEIDPEGATYETANRVLRGGSWDFLANHVRAAYRQAREPSHCYGDVGFRCARVQGA